jgi:uncharacterized protein (DUF2141 family)
MRKRALTWVLGGIIWIISGWKAPYSPTLTVEITGIKNNKGSIIVAIFDNEKDFLKKDMVHRKTAAVANGIARVRFEGLAPGTYAASVIHDENDNGKLDTNMVGIPRESFGFSNNPKVTFGPPGYKTAGFELKNEPKEISIRLISFL